MNKQLSILAGVLALSLTPMARAADAPPAPLPPATEASVSTRQYFALRVCDIAPQFTLTDATGKLWNSREQLGQRALLLLLTDEAPVTEQPTPASLAASSPLADQVQKLRASGVEVVQAGSRSWPHLVSLRDERQALWKLFGSDAAHPVLAAIDKAGFIRRLELIRNPQEIGAMMEQLGASTPKLEVGKPAPDFSLPDMNGQVRRLADLRGQKNLILTFFPKCFTGG